MYSAIPRRNVHLYLHITVENENKRQKEREKDGKREQNATSNFIPRPCCCSLMIRIFPTLKDAMPVVVQTKFYVCVDRWLERKEVKTWRGNKYHFINCKSFNFLTELSGSATEDARVDSIVDTHFRIYSPILQGISYACFAVCVCRKTIASNIPSWCVNEITCMGPVEKITSHMPLKIKFTTPFSTTLITTLTKLSHHAEVFILVQISVCIGIMCDK